MLLRLLFGCWLLLATAFSTAAEIETQGGEEIADPYWFKQSFLEFADDAAEAAEGNRHVMLYFHQKGCPYCYAMVRNNFLDAQLSPFIQKHFDIISLNIWGDREITLADGTVLSEKELAAKWSVQYTPTLVFLKGDGTPGLRIDGYRPKPVFSKILDYVISGDQSVSLSQKLIEKTDQTMYPQPFLIEPGKLADAADRPKALLIEYPGCKACTEFHVDILSRQTVNQPLEKFAVARIDATSEQPVTFPDGVKRSPAAWVKEMGLSYYPSVFLYDHQGQEQLRIDSYVRAFHFISALHYVAEKQYQQHDGFQRYINVRADHMRESGQAVRLAD